MPVGLRYVHERGGEMTDWIRTDERLPENSVIVETKISDRDGTRNVRKLKRGGDLWFYPDCTAFVYYTPTHWRPLTEPERT
jgi:hypothetical protein